MKIFHSTGSHVCRPPQRREFMIQNASIQKGSELKINEAFILSQQRNRK